ncbi:transposase zinc-binding domain-containing protein, partial [Aquimarina sp. RZ0]|uniref:IS91 family transposase n=1 Tax=Aquimarina sp. RZ0 TaxID=2607730 RepID=UPI0011F2248F
MQAQFELGDILREQHKYIETSSFTTWQKRTLFALSRCRTAALGGHIDQCDNPECSKLHLSYNSCRNRHCPKCQGHKRELWIPQRQAELLAVGYYHLVFTLPSELNELTLVASKLVYDTLFKAVWYTLDGFSENPKFLGARTGMISILHTWGSNMSLHPHLHCIVPAGGITKDGNWKNAPSVKSSLNRRNLVSLKKTKMGIRYKVSLTKEERTDLLNIIHKGKHTSQAYRNAYILLNTDKSEFSTPLTNMEIS